MRDFFSILIFIAFAIRPVIEIGTVTYYQLNIDTIIEKYCVNKKRPKLNCNGKCYLMSQIKKNTQSTNKQKESIVITEAFIPLYFQDTPTEIKFRSLSYNQSDENWKLKQIYSEDIPKSIDQPPQFFSTLS